jgi:thioredoxin reductase
MVNAMDSGENMNRLRESAWYDVVVVGGGAAGLSGALALARARRSVLVVDGGQPRNAPATHMHNYLSRDGTPPSELLALGQAEVTSYGGHVIAGRVATLERLDNSDARGGFRVVLADGTSVQARRLLVATGLIDVLPDIPGVAERWGRDVLHCPYCHGWEVRDQAIGILGTGPMAVHVALLFRQWSADVTLFQHSAPALSAEQAEQLAARGIAIIDGEVAGLEVQDDRLSGVRLRSGALIPRQAVVVTPQFAARAEVLRALGLETTDQEFAGSIVSSYIAADPMGATAVPGVWVAGNIADPFAQVIAAAAAGLKAGAAINADLIAEETARAVAAFRAQGRADDAPRSGQTERSQGAPAA